MMESTNPIRRRPERRSRGIAGKIDKPKAPPRVSMPNYKQLEL